MNTKNEPSMRQPDYVFDVTSDTFTSDEVMLKFELSFGAACQVLKILADQNWHAAMREADMREMDSCSGIYTGTKPPTVVFTLVGKLSSSCPPTLDCTGNPGSNSQ